jgi:hypothetical protein
MIPNTHTTTITILVGGVALSLNSAQFGLAPPAISQMFSNLRHGNVSRTYKPCSEPWPTKLSGIFTKEQALQEAAQQRSRCHRKLVSKKLHSSEAAAIESVSPRGRTAAKPLPSSRTAAKSLPSKARPQEAVRIAAMPLPSKACLQEAAQQ